MSKFTILDIDIRRASDVSSILMDKGQDPQGIENNLHVSVQRKTTTD
jgi:hypothetical protein